MINKQFYLKHIVPSFLTYNPNKKSAVRVIQKNLLVIVNLVMRREREVFNRQQRRICSDSYAFILDGRLELDWFDDRMHWKFFSIDFIQMITLCSMN